MSEIDTTSEEYALEYENRFMNEYKNVDIEYPKFKKYISEQLSNCSVQSHMNISNAYNNTSYFEQFKNNTEFAYMFLVVQIYNSEFNAKYKETILDISNKIEDYVLLIEQCKFILWRIEFIGDIESKNFLIHFINTYNISPFFIEKIIETSTFSTNLLFKLAEFFNNNGMLKYAFHILNLMNRLNPGNEEILCTLASFTAGIGRKDKAIEYISQINNPGEPTERIRIKYGL